MATKKKGQLTTTNEWVRHLRKFFHRRFWKNERQAQKKQIQKELSTK